MLCHMTERVITEAQQWGAHLKQLRKQAGLTQTELADRITYSRALVTAFERGTRRPKSDQIHELDKALATGGVLAERWREVSSSDSAVPREWQSYLTTERTAVEIRDYAANLIPGMMQTFDYAREVLNPSGAPFEDLDERATVRTSRIEYLRPEVRVWALIEESALRRVVGSPDVQAAALDHLAILARRPGIRVGVVPERARRPAVGGGWRVARIPDGRLIGYVDHALGEAVVQHARQVNELLRYFGDLQGEALGMDASLEALARIRGDL